MPVLAFSMTAADHTSRRYEFRGANNTEYYDGELKPLSDTDVSMRIDKSVAGEYVIYKLTSRTGLSFRRSWSHIRNDNTDMTVFWFVRRGEMTVAHSDQRHRVRAGECAITRSSKAFYMEMIPDAAGQFEVMHVLASSHRFFGVLRRDVDNGRPYPASCGDLHLAEQILALLFEQEGEINAVNAGHLAGTLLDGIARTIELGLGDPAPKTTILDRRIEDIVGYVDRHFTNIDLNAKTVAQHCGISLRYLCHVLKQRDLSFSRLLWERRMAAAEEWLGNQTMRNGSINEIAFLAGFKSSAHFSRMFKLWHGIAPREYRQQQLRIAH